MVSSIGGKHYTDWTLTLDKDYERILPRIKKYLTKTDKGIGVKLTLIHS